MALKVSGAHASVRWSYHLAATIGAWAIERPDPEGDAPVATTLTASIVSSDSFRLSQQPLEFVVHHAKGVWRWPIVTLQIVGASLAATLGPKGT